MIRRSETAATALLGSRARVITATQDRVVKVGRVRFARIKGDDDPLMPGIHFYIVHAFDFHEWPAELSESTMVILAFRSDFDRFQNRVVGAFREKGIGWIRIVWSCRVHSFLFI
jgi:hypothetical protein